MAVKILWQPPLVPEERKKAQWENIIRFELGEGSLRSLDVRPPSRGGAPPVAARTPRSPQDRAAEYAAACRGRLVGRAPGAGKPARRQGPPCQSPCQRVSHRRRYGPSRLRPVASGSVTPSSSASVGARS